MRGCFADVMTLAHNALPSCRRRDLPRRRTWKKRRKQAISEAGPILILLRAEKIRVLIILKTQLSNYCSEQFIGAGVVSVLQTIKTLLEQDQHFKGYRS
jgi:hypothetical protein